MLVLAPAACCLAGVAVHEALKVLMRSLRQAPDVDEQQDQVVDSKPAKSSTPARKGKTNVKVRPGLL